MHVLVVQNFEGASLGQVAIALDEANATVETIRADKGEQLPDGANGYDALVVLGGAQNALADDICPWLPALCDLMRDFSEADRSVLGICLGSQLLARAYGAQNVVGGATEFGWREVELTGDGVADPIFEGVGERFRTFEWHDDTFMLPGGAIRLAGNLDVQNQAFRVGRAAYGMQFHFEADRPMVEQWSDAFATLLADLQPGWAERHPTEAALHGPQADAAGMTIARNWVRTIVAP